MSALSLFRHPAGLLLPAVLATGCEHRASSGASQASSAAPAEAPAEVHPAARTSPVQPLKRRTYTLAANGKWVHAGTTAGLVSWDLSNPASPREVASMTLAGSVSHVAVIDSASHLLALSTGPTGIAVVDAGGIGGGKLALHGEHPWSAEARGGCHAAWKLAPAGGKHGFVACGGGGIGEAEVADGAGLRILGTLDAGGYVRDLEVLDASSGVKTAVGKKRVAAVAGTGGLAIADFGGPGVPKIVARVALPGEARALDVEGGLAFVAAGAAGLQIVDVQDPARATLIGAFQPDVTDMARGVVVRDRTAYVCFGESGLVIVDVRNPQVPVRVGGYDPDRSLNRALLQGDLLVTANDDDGLLLLDVKDPAKPVVVHPAHKAGR